MSYKENSIHLFYFVLSPTSSTWELDRMRDWLISQVNSWTHCSATCARLPPRDVTQVWSCGKWRLKFLVSLFCESDEVKEQRRAAAGERAEGRADYREIWTEPQSGDFPLARARARVCVCACVRALCTHSCGLTYTRTNRSDPQHSVQSRAPNRASELSTYSTTLNSKREKNRWVNIYYYLNIYIFCSFFFSHVSVSG